MGYHHETKIPDNAWEVIKRLPAFRYTKEPVDTVADLYNKYPAGNDDGVFCFVKSENTFYRFYIHKRIWAPIGGYTAFEVWVQQPGNEEKTEEDFFAWLKEEALEAAESANTAAALANEKAALANEKAVLADEKAALAGEKAALADEKATLAEIAAEYAREQGDYAAAQDVVQFGHRLDKVEEDKIDGGYSEEGLLYLTSGGTIVGDPIPVGSGSGGSGSGGGGGSTLRLQNRGSASMGVPVGQPAWLRYTFTSVDSETDEPTGYGTVAYFVNNARVYTKSIPQGDVDFDIAAYLSSGKNQVLIQVTDSYGTVRALNIRIEIIGLQLTSTFDDSPSYHSPIHFPYTPTGTGEKTIHFILDGVELEPVITTATNRQLYYDLPALTHGSHSFEAYAAMESEGVIITSDTLRFSIIYVLPDHTGVIISSSFARTEASQYDNLLIPFSVYDPVASSAGIQFKANGETVSTQTVDRLPQIWAYRIPGYGALTLEIVCGTVTKEFNLSVAKSSINSEAETENLELFLTSDGRSNNEINPGVWVDNTIESLFTGFNYKTNGWVADDDGITTLRISQGAKVEIPFLPFFSDFKSSGKTIEVEFRVKNVENFTSTIISCFSGGRGFKITANDILFQSELSSVKAKFKEDEKIRISFVVESLQKNRIVYTYINGIASGSIRYTINDIFEQTPPVGITLGSAACTLDVYTIRSYAMDLNAYQILNNYIADTALVSRKLELYDNNQVYDSTGEIIYSLLVNQLPCMTIIGELPTFKGDKKTVSMTFEHLQAPEKSFTADNVQIDVQGTSSQYYPRKNFKHKFKNGLTLTETGEHVDKYTLRENSIPVDTFCEKADFAESSGTHNTGMSKYINDALVQLNYRTPAQVGNDNVRTTVDGYPIAIFHKANANSPALFIGKYNFNNDKSTQETFGFDGADECWEFLNNTADRCLFKSADFSGTGWLDDFEGRYPDGHTDASNLAVVAGWVVSCIGNPAKFKSEAAGHFNVNNLLSYYLITELFGMVDQRAKNMMLASWGNEGSGAYKWYFIFYDSDTCLGINNEGVNVFGFHIEDGDTLGGGHVWNGWDSELWKLVKTAFADELAVMYRNMRQTGALSYDGAIRVLNEEQAFKWCEVVYNMDGYYKYIQPMIESGQATYLYALQGSRTEHRVWWLSNRFFYMDSKYDAADFLNDFITMRIYTPSVWQGVAPNADFDLTPYKDSYVRVKYGSYILEQRASAEETVHIQAPNIQFNDTETIIYGISAIKGIGSLAALYAGTVDIANATTLIELIAGSAEGGYVNENLSHVSAGNNRMLRVVDIQNCPNYTEPLDLSGCNNIEVVRAKGSSVSMVVLPEAGMLNRMELPATIVNLTIKNQQLLLQDNLILDGIDNISTLVLERMNGLDQIELVKALLAVDPVKLNRVRLIDVNLEDDNLDTLIVLSAIGGLDENGLPVERAVVTGKIRVAEAGETTLAVCREMFPELEITVTTVIEDPTLTIEFFSTQNKPVANTNFLASVPFTQIDDVTYSIKYAPGTSVNYSFSADNHIPVTGSYTIGITETRLFPVTYIPLRTLVIRRQTNSTPIEGATVKVAGTGLSYLTDAEGKVAIRRIGAFDITVESNYGAGGFSVTTSETDTSTTFSIYPYVTVTATARKQKSLIPLAGAVFVFKNNASGWTAEETANELGRVTLTMSKGNYTCSVFFKGVTLITNYSFTVNTSNVDLGNLISYDLTQSILPSQFKPVSNGNIQFMLTKTASGMSGVSYDSAAPIRIDWGDGTVEPFSATEGSTINAYHTYSEWNVAYQVEILDCEEVTYVGSKMDQNAYFAAFWTIGNSKINQGSLFCSYNGEFCMEYAGADMFKYCATKTDFSYALYHCSNLVEMESGIFDTWVNATTLIYTFWELAWKNKPRINLSHCTKIITLDNAFTGAKIDRLPIITSKKITSIFRLQYPCTLKEVRKEDIPVNEDGATINTGYAFYLPKSVDYLIFEIPDSLTNLGAYFFYNSAPNLSGGGHIQIFQTTPPTITDTTFSPLSVLVSDGIFIYVPDASVVAYKAATNWSTYASIIKPASEKPA